MVIFFYWWALLFTGRPWNPKFGSQKYPPFLLMTPAVTLNLPAPPASTPRRNLFNWFLAIPHNIVLLVLSIRMWY